MRKEVEVKVNDRGKELTFKIKEMSASQQESWVIRAGLLLGKGDLSDVLATETTQMLKVLSGIDYDKAKPLLDELLGCCYLVHNKTVTQLNPSTVDGVIEDVSTLFKLKIEAFKVNFNFFLAVNPSGSSD